MDNLIQPFPTPTLFQARTLLKHPAILALKNSTITITPAAGTGKLIVPIKILLLGHIVGGYTGSAQDDAFTLAYNGINVPIANLPNAAVPPSGANTPLYVFLEGLGDSFIDLHLPLARSLFTPGWNLGPSPPRSLFSESVGKSLIMGLEFAGVMGGGHVDNIISIIALYAIFNVTTGLFE